MPLLWLPRMPEVTPYAGVWIETVFSSCHTDRNYVTPYAGVWIET